jgi:hypothetical protein
MCVLITIISAAACRHPVSMEQKLDAWVVHQRKMEVILQDLQMECDSSNAATLRYRCDSLEAALSPAKDATAGKPSSTPAHTPHHTHHKTGHHHHGA